MSKIEWDKDERVLYTGRNGTGFCCGVLLTNLKEKVEVSPLNSKGYSARCGIEIPKSKLSELIKALEEIRDA